MGVFGLMWLVLLVGVTARGRCSVDAFFDEMSALVESAPGGKPSLEQLRELNRKHDFVLVEDWPAAGTSVAARSFPHLLAPLERTGRR